MFSVGFFVKSQQRIHNNYAVLLSNVAVSGLRFLVVPYGPPTRKGLLGYLTTASFFILARFALTPCRTPYNL
jgi:hypothetical protein